MIQGLEISPLKVIADNRGKVMKMIDVKVPLFEKFGEIYFSFVYPGVIKGWKKHLRAVQLFAVPIGMIKFVVYDDRSDSPTGGKTEEIEIGEENYHLIKMPAGVWYSWQAISVFPAMIASLTSEPHDPAEAVSAEINNNNIIPYQWKQFMETVASTKHPKVSVIMNCYNSNKFLREAIDSVYAQTFEDWEIIFWDNASTDTSPTIAKSYDDKLKYFHGEKNVPLGQARNFALEKARGDYIAFLDCDDHWLPEKLAKQVPGFEQNPRVGLVISDTIFFKDNKEVKQLYARKKPPTGNIFRHLLTDYFISLETAMIRKAALATLDHWFDDRFNMMEESDLFTRIAHDWELDFIDEVLAKWRMHNANWSYLKKDLAVREKQLLLDKLCCLYSGFEKEFAIEIKIIKSQISLRAAKLDWENNKKAEARARLKPYLSASRRHRLFYALTFLPYSFYKAIYKLRGMDPL
mgnify:CR=1 FL=1